MTTVHVIKPIQTGDRQQFPVLAMAEETKLMKDEDDQEQSI